MLNKVKGNLLSEIRGEQFVAPRRVPLLVQIVENLEADDKKDLLEALDDHSFTAASIARALTKRGHRINPAIIQAYRRGEYNHVFKN